MKQIELLERISLEASHYEWTESKLPKVEPGIYNTLGRRLFDLYRKYDLTPEDQRELEALVWVLHSFTVSEHNRVNTQKPWWRRWV